jgi:hypothetical protein
MSLLAAEDSFASLIDSFSNTCAKSLFFVKRSAFEMHQYTPSMQNTFV